MPYDNMPADMQDKMGKCVTDVQGKGKDKEASIKICYSSLMKGKEINYRKFILPTAKELFNAEELRKSGRQFAIDELKRRGIADPTEDLVAKFIDEELNVQSAKSIIDAPNLRSEDERNCWNCKYFTPLPDSTMQENVNDVAGKLSAPSDLVEMASGRGTCSQFEFETDREWICDAWETYVTEPTIATMKQTDGKYRWILFSSSSYQDKDGEIVSQKALESDTKRMNTTKEYGTLDWWHTPIVLGDCDFSEMHGRISIESGTFRDDWIGERFATMKNLGASRMFYNPANEPDAEGVYNNIRTFRRAILPADRASNRLTLVDISAKEQQMTMKDKVSELISKLGGTPEAEKKVADLVQAAEQADTAAASAGLTSKETAPEVPATTPETKAWFVSDMTPDEFDARLTAVVEKFLTPAVKEIGAHVASMNDANTITAKETSDKLVAQLKSTQDMQTDLSARLAALEGLTPRAYRATSDPKTAVSATTVKEATPKGDGKANDSLASWLTAA